MHSILPSTLSFLHSAVMTALNHFTDHCHAYGIDSPPPFPSLPFPVDGLHTCSQLPQTLTQLVLRFGWELITSLWILAKMRVRFFKRSKVRLSFFGLLYFVKANLTVEWSVPCVACVPPAVFSAEPHLGNDFRSLLFNVLPSQICFFHWIHQNSTLG